MRIRSFRHPGDLDEIRRLLAKCRSADDHPPLSETKYRDLLRNATTSRKYVVESDHEVIAYVHLSSDGTDVDWVLEAAIDPEHRDPLVVREVMQSALELTAAADGGIVRVWAYLPTVAAVAESLGFSRERELLQMRLVLPARQAAIPPAGLRLAPFRVGADEDAWIRVNNRAFAGHPENGAWTRATLNDRFEQDWFDPDGFLLAWQGSDLAGFCWTKVHPGPVGEIYVVAVDPAHRRRSLGTWLTLEGLDYLHRSRKATRAMLYVDAANAPARVMYERLGFELDHVDRSLVRAPATSQPATGDPNTRSHDGHA